MNEVPKRILSDEEMVEIAKIDPKEEEDSIIKDFISQEQADKLAGEAKTLEQVRLDKLGEESVHEEHEGSDIALDE